MKSLKPWRAVPPLDRTSHDMRVRDFLPATWPATWFEKEPAGWTTPVTLIGYPYAPVGRGEHLRAVWRALGKAEIAAAVVDARGRKSRRQSEFKRLRRSALRRLPGGIRIFHLNGNAVAAELARMDKRQPGFFRAGYNIVYPAWELPRYPDEWSRQLDRFDEVWTATDFVREVLQSSVSVPVRLLRNACEPEITEILGRRYFGLPEDRYLLLFSFDLWSLATRKNPFATIDAFRKLIAARPKSNAHLVLKLNHPEADAATIERLRSTLAGLGDRVSLIAATMTNNEARNLTRCCDCYISLHRSEGFGRGPAEAMFFGKPALATGWSGNMEYMNAENSFPIRYELVPVREGEFPVFEGQVWAEADSDHAAEILVRLIDDPDHGRRVGERAREHMLRNFSDDVLGLAYRQRLSEITASGAIRAV
jgi:glycosyltransferase involved in cell wall biosynthesis